MSLLFTEMRRALRRRLVRVMILLALVGIAVAGVVDFVMTADVDPMALRLAGQHDPFVMTDWWVPGSAEGALAVSAFMLMMGGLVGGASVAGAEWRSGTVTTVLTWEPRRIHLHLARTAAAGLLAAAIALVLQILFLAGFVPAVLAHGTTEGVDGAWLLSITTAILRVSLLTAVSAVIGSSVATLGRNTAAALVGAWAWLAIGESLVRGLKPTLARWLVGENSAVVLTWAGLDQEQLDLDPATALARILVYSAGVALLALWSFQRRDVAAA